jgi:hypothetical protein
MPEMTTTPLGSVIESNHESLIRTRNYENTAADRSFDMGSEGC